MPQHELLACAQCGCFAFSCFEDFAIRVRSYDIAPDGRRFVMRTAASAELQPMTDIRIVLNWLEELKRLVPADN